MKIILSRKGFDKGSGGYPSPYFVDENLLYSLPIPNNDNYFSYKDLRFNDELSCYNLMEQLGISARKFNAHTDPDVRKDLYINPPENWEPLFGQQAKPQKTLEKNKVGTGDLFLFYGLFKDVKKINGKYRFIDGTTKQIIWGYFEVQEVVDVVDNKIGSFHPHYYSHSTYTANTIYRPTEKLSFAPNMSGCGCLTFNKNLVLSKCDNDKADIYNVFSLPNFFLDTKIVGNRSLAQPDGNMCTLKFPNRGQEFVISENNAVTDWVKELLGI